MKKQKEALAEKEAELEINKRTLFQLEEMEPKILELENSKTTRRIRVERSNDKKNKLQQSQLISISQLEWQLNEWAASDI
ncbi:Undefined function [Listeria monocytogenes N53-1]|nr:Undefined function [Listeria monocytogenes N53-1]